jgi:hypothetical protein
MYPSQHVTFGSNSLGNEHGPCDDDRLQAEDPDDLQAQQAERMQRQMYELQCRINDRMIDAGLPGSLGASTSRMSSKIQQLMQHAQHLADVADQVNQPTGMLL